MNNNNYYLIIIVKSKNITKLFILFQQTILSDFSFHIGTYLLNIIRYLLNLRFSEKKNMFYNKTL